MSPKAVRFRQLGPRQRKLATLMAQHLGVNASYWIRTYGIRELPREQSIDPEILTMDLEEFSKRAAVVMDRRLFQVEPSNGRRGQRSAS